MNKSKMNSLLSNTWNTWIKNPIILLVLSLICTGLLFLKNSSYSVDSEWVSNSQEWYMFSTITVISYLLLSNTIYYIIDESKAQTLKKLKISNLLNVKTLTIILVQIPHLVIISNLYAILDFFSVSLQYAIIINVVMLIISSIAMSIFKLNYMFIDGSMKECTAISIRIIKNYASCLLVIACVWGIVYYFNFSIGHLFEDYPDIIQIISFVSVFLIHSFYKVFMYELFIDFHENNTQDNDITKHIISE